jgi:hypothetical protein
MAASAEIPPRVRQLVTELAQPRPMRRGSVSERTIKYGKAGCACADDPKARHGPYYKPDSDRGRQDAVAVSDGGAGRCGPAANCSRAQVSRTARHLLGGLRGVGRRPDGASASGLLRAGPKRGLQMEIQNDIVQEIEALLGRQSIWDLDFEAAEMAARRQALRLAARVLEQRLNADTSDHAGPELPCTPHSQQDSTQHS